MANTKKTKEAEVEKVVIPTKYAAKEAYKPVLLKKYNEEIAPALHDKFNYTYIDDEDDTTEATEKMFATETGGKFDIILDIVKVNTSAIIGD